MALIDPQLYDQAGSVFNVDPGLLRAIARVESGENINVGNSTAGAIGPMQFMPGTARMYGLNNPRDPVQAVFGAAAYMRDLLDKHNGDVPAALQEYNGATGDRTRKYTGRVVAEYKPVAQRSQSGDAAAISDDALSDVDRFLTAPGKTAPASAPAPTATKDAPLSPTDTLSDVDRFLAPAAPAAPASPPTEAGGSSPTTAPTQPPATPDATSSVMDWIPPVVRNFGAGFVQGARDVGQTVAGWERRADEAVPLLATIDRLGHVNPGADEQRFAGQTKDFEATHGDSTAASIGRVAGNIAITAPVIPGGIVGGTVGRVAGAVVPRVAANLLRGAVEGAVTGAGTNAFTSGPSGENPLDAAKEGATTGAILGGAMPLVRGVISGVAGTTGRALRSIADRLGIDLTTGQEVGGIAARIEDASKIIPGSGAARAASTQNSQIAQAIAREAGIPGPVRQLTTPTLNAAETRIGDAINNAAGRIDVPGTGPVGNALLNRLGQIETNAAVSGTDAPQAKAASKLIDRIMETMSNRGGSMPGSDFQRFIARDNELQAAINSGGEVGRVATAIREALFDAAEASGSTGVADLRNARYQWKVVQTVRDAIDKTVDGSESMSQARLAQLIRNNFDMSRTGPGNNMQDLARLLQGVRPLASSGTAERLAMYGALGLGGGGGAYYYMQHPDETENALLQYGLPAAGAILAGRASRFGPGLGMSGPRVLNPLLPRVMGPLYRPPAPNDQQ